MNVIGSIQIEGKLDFQPETKPFYTIGNCLRYPCGVGFRTCIPEESFTTDEFRNEFIKALKDIESYAKYRIEGTLK